MSVFFVVQLFIGFGDLKVYSISILMCVFLHSHDIFLLVSGNRETSKIFGAVVNSSVFFVYEYFKWVFII